MDAWISLEASQATQERRGSHIIDRSVVPKDLFVILSYIIFKLYLYALRSELTVAETGNIYIFLKGG